VGCRPIRRRVTPSGAEPIGSNDADVIFVKPTRDPATSLGELGKTPRLIGSASWSESDVEFMLSVPKMRWHKPGQILRVNHLDEVPGSHVALTEDTSKGPDYDTSARTLLTRFE
jgi:hypothetical protein